MFAKMTLNYWRHICTFVEIIETMVKKTNGIIISQRNVFTAARYIFTTMEKRIIYVLASRLNGMQGDLFGELVESIPVKLLLKHEDDENYTAIKQAAKSLVDKTIEIKTEKRWEVFSILSGAVMEKGSGTIQITLSHHIIPFFINLKNEPEITRLGFNQALSLKSHYSQRFYEFMSRYKDTGWWTVSMEELRSMLKLESSYGLWGDFRRRILDTSQKELAEKTELGFTYTPLKEGKRIVRLDFKIFSTERKTEDSFIDNNLNINYRKVRENLRLSDHQAKSICSKVSADDITKTLYDIQLAKANNRIHTSLASYSWNTFINKFPELQNKVA